MEVSQAMGTPSNSSLGDHMRGVRRTWVARGLDDQLVEDHVGLKSEAETRLYELDDSRLPW